MEPLINLSLVYSIVDICPQYLVYESRGSSKRGWKPSQVSTGNPTSYIVNAIEAKLRELETEELLKEIDEMNRELKSGPAPPSWKLIREDRER